MKCLSTKATSIKPSGIRKFFDLASTMEGVISLGVGEPDFATPWHICENAIHYMSTGHTHYTANRGLLELREAICKFHKEHYMHKPSRLCAVCQRDWTARSSKAARISPAVSSSV